MRSARVGIGLLLFALFLALYVGFRSNDHYYDSVDYALVVEGDDARLFWQKHILQHAFVKLFYSIQLALGLGWRALPVAQVISAIAGAGTVAMLFALVVELTSDARLSACFAVLLGFRPLSPGTRSKAKRTPCRCSSCARRC